MTDHKCQATLYAGNSIIKDELNSKTAGIPCDFCGRPMVIWLVKMFDRDGWPEELAKRLEVAIQKSERRQNETKT